MTPERLAPPNTDFSRLWFGQEQDVGEAVFSSTPRSFGGFRSRYVVARDGILGLAWTDIEVLVCSGTRVAITLKRLICGQIFQFQIDGKALDHFCTQVQPEGVGKILAVQFVDSQTFVVLGVSFRCATMYSMFTRCSNVSSGGTS